MFYLRYIASELRRRRGRTIFTALGLGVGVALVVAVSALSHGLNKAQSKVLGPLAGVGTNMSVTRPISVTGSGSAQRFRPGAGGPQISAKDREELQKENGGGRLGFGQLGKAGKHFDITRFMTTNLSFSESEAKKIDTIKGVTATAGGLTLDMIHLSGTAPKASETSSQGGFARGGFAGGGAPPRIQGGFSFQPISVSGIDASQSSLSMLPASQITKGKYLATGEVKQAVLSQSYADEKSISIGDKVEVGGKKFEVVGLAKAPLGGQASDIYVPLSELQKLSQRKGRINTLEVSASNANQVNAVAKEIKRVFKGSQTTTSKQLAEQVTGSLVDAKKLSTTLGTALAIVALLAAFLIASLLTISSVNKRVREIGTLKAIGWSQRLVVRQISGEAVAQGLLGGVIGAVLGIAAAAVIGALGITLKATTVLSGSSGSPFGGGGPFGGGSPIGGGGGSGGSSTAVLTAPVDVGIVLLAIALAVLGGLIAGAVGGLRAARLRPAEALRSVE